MYAITYCFYLLKDLSEDDVTSIEPASLYGADELGRNEKVFGWGDNQKLTNWEPLVSLPALAMERMPGPVCLSLL